MFSSTKIIRRQWVRWSNILARVADKRNSIFYRKCRLSFNFKAQLLMVTCEGNKFFKREHNHDFSKIAVVTDNQWIT